MRQYYSLKTPLFAANGAAMPPVVIRTSVAAARAVA
jgi:hypothetical protein